MPVTYRSLGSWCDVCALPDGRFVGVHAEMGQVVAQIIGGPVLWQTPVSTDILRYLRCAASAEHVCAIGVGADDHAYLVSAFGQLVLGPVGGQNAVAIGWNGRAFVMYRTLYDPASREIKTYARRVNDTGSDVILPIPIGHTSQGFREAIPGPSPTEDRIIWSDNLHFQHVGGGVLHKPSERNDVIVGQVNGPDHIHGWNGSQFFHAIDGPAFEPHIAANGRGEYAIAARTGRGAAFVIVPPYQPLEEPKPVAQLDIIKAIREKYPTPLGDTHARFLLECAAATNMGLLRKTGGTRIPLPAPHVEDGHPIEVSQDILMEPSSGRIFDFLGDGEGAAMPGWSEAVGSPQPLSRLYLPVSDGGDDGDPGDENDGDGDPPVDAELLKRIAALEAKVAALETAQYDIRIIRRP